MEDINLSKVSRDSNPNLGNGLVASVDLDPGVAIIQISDPYIITVQNAALGQVCSFCFVSTEALKKCSGCKVDQYCSTTCQQASWKKVHKQECAILKKLPKVPPTPVRALMQVLLKRNSAAEIPPWTSLEAHREELMKHMRWDGIVLQAKAASSYVPGWSDKLEIVVAVACRIATNAFRATLWEDTPVGLCFDPTLALANHSCVPNAAITFDGRQVFLRSLDVIKKGEQIFVSYVDHTQRRETRQAELQDRYFFRCECEKCANDDSPYATFQKSNVEPSSRLNLLCDINTIKVHAKTCIEVASSPTVAPELASLTTIQTKVDAHLEQSKTNHSQLQRLQTVKQALSSLHPLSAHRLYATPPFPAILHELYLFYLDNNLYVQALIILIFIFQNCDAYNYPQPQHPVRVLRLFTIAKLLKHIASLSCDELEKFARETGVQKEVVLGIDWISTEQAVLLLVEGFVGMSHGRGSRFMKEVEKEMDEVMEVQRLRGNVGMKLMLWGRDGDEAVEGRQYARKVFEGLRVLGECAFTVIEKTNV